MTKILIDRAVVEQALEALHEIEWSNDTRWQSDRAATVIPAFRAALAEPDYWQEEARRYAGNADYWRKRYEALAEPVQEPVQCSNTFACRCPKHYTTPPQRKPLSEEEIAKCWHNTPWNEGLKTRVFASARAIEAAHGIKEKK